MTKRYSNFRYQYTTHNIHANHMWKIVGNSVEKEIRDELALSFHENWPNMLKDDMKKEVIEYCVEAGDE